MSFFYTRLFVLIAMLLPVLAGCQSYTRTLGPTNPTITDAKQGQDCRSQFGIGDVPDLTGTQAIRSGGITKHLFRRGKRVRDRSRRITDTATRVRGSSYSGSTVRRKEGVRK